MIDVMVLLTAVVLFLTGTVFGVLLSWCWRALDVWKR